MFKCLQPKFKWIEVKTSVRNKEVETLPGHLERARLNLGRDLLSPSLLLTREEGSRGNIVSGISMKQPHKRVSSYFKNCKDMQPN